MEAVQRNVKEAKTFLLRKELVKQISKGCCDTDTFVKLEEIFSSLFEQVNLNNEELDDKTRLILIDTFSIWIVRSTKILCNTKVDSDAFSETLQKTCFTKEKCNLLFSYIIEYWSSGTPALANSLRDFLSKIINLSLILFDHNIYKELTLNWLDTVLDKPSTERIQYFLIDILSSDVDMFHIIQKKPDFIGTSLSDMSKESLSNIIGKGLVSLLTNIYNKKYEANEKNIDNWLELFAAPTLRYFQLDKFSKPLSLYFLIPLFKNVPETAFIRFLENKTIQDRPGNLLATLKIGQSLSIEEPFHNNRLISLTLLREFLETNEYKLEAFELLTYSTQKSRAIHSYVFDLVQNNMKIFFVDTELERRNYFISSFKNFLIRIRDSAYALNRKLSKLRAVNKFPEEQKETADILKKYYTFLEWLVSFLKCELIPGVQYQRASTSLQILRVLVESGLDSGIADQYFYQQERRAYPFSLSVSADASLFRLLIDNLANSISDIRQQSKALLLMFNSSDDSHYLFQNLDTQHIHNMIIKNMKTYQNADISATLESFLFKISSDETSYLEAHLVKLNSEVNKLKKFPLLIADNNISCFLSSLSMILEELNTSALEEIYLSRTLEGTWDNILDIWELVREILCYDSSDSIFPTKYLDGNASEQQISSYAYRSVKEISSVLIVMMEKYSLSEKMLISIGDLLINQLFSIRHSGAFQAVLPAFRKCCVRINKELPQQLGMWLNLVLMELETKTQHITRRSGGLPFLLTYILSAETTKGRPQLQMTFEKLFDLMSSEVKEHQDKLDLPQINAFNCVKALFIEPSLADSCHPYISKAMEFSFDSFTSNIWALRNCSLMLFTAIQNRVFGKSGKLIGARLFFTRYQGLRESMLKILRNTTEVHYDHKKGETSYESIFLVLNMLLSLQPTNGYDEINVILLEVDKLLGNPNWKVRDVAARVLTRLTINLPELISVTIQKLKLSDQNRLHGNLLIILYALSSYQDISDDKVSEMDIRIGSCLIKMIRIMTEENNCFVTCQSYLQIMHKLFEIITLEKLPQMNEFFDVLRIYFSYHIATYEQNGSKQLCLSKALEILLRYGPSEYIFPLCEYGLNSSFYEVQDTALKFFLEYDLLHLITSNEREAVCLRMRVLLKCPTTLPVTKSLLLDVLQDFEGAFTREDVLELFSTINPESTKLEALAGLGKSIEPENIEEYIAIVHQYTADDSATIARSSALLSLKNCSERIKNKTILLHLHKYLFDDDVDIRNEAAIYINDIFLKGGDSTLRSSPYNTCQNLGTIYDTILDGSQTSLLMMNEIKYFFERIELFTTDVDDSHGVFQVEKANQYRNDIEQIAQYVTILFTSNKLDILKTFMSNYLDSFSHSISECTFNDSILGWLSNPDIFSRVIILRLIVGKLWADKLERLDLTLKSKEAHPLVFEYIFD